MNEWRRYNTQQSTLGSRVYAQGVKVHAQDEFKELQSPDQGSEGRGNQDAVSQGIIVGHSILSWGGTRVLKGRFYMNVGFVEVVGLKIELLREGETVDHFPEAMRRPRDS